MPDNKMDDEYFDLLDEYYKKFGECYGLESPWAVVTEETKEDIRRRIRENDPQNFSKEYDGTYAT